MKLRAATPATGRAVTGLDWNAAFRVREITAKDGTLS
jgi:hypothetical protein